MRDTAKPSLLGRIVPNSVIAADTSLTLTLREPAKHVLRTELKLVCNLGDFPWLSLSGNAILIRLALLAV